MTRYTEIINALRHYFEATDYRLGLELLATSELYRLVGERTQQRVQLQALAKQDRVECEYFVKYLVRELLETAND